MAIPPPRHPEKGSAGRDRPSPNYFGPPGVLPRPRSGSSGTSTYLPKPFLHVEALPLDGHDPPSRPRTKLLHVELGTPERSPRSPQTRFSSSCIPAKPSYISPKPPYVPRTSRRSPRGAPVHPGGVPVRPSGAGEGPLFVTTAMSATAVRDVDHDVDHHARRPPWGARRYRAPRRCSPRCRAWTSCTPRPRAGNTFLT